MKNDAEPRNRTNVKNLYQALAWEHIKPVPKKAKASRRIVACQWHGPPAVPAAVAISCNFSGLGVAGNGAIAEDNHPRLAEKWTRTNQESPQKTVKSRLEGLGVALWKRNGRDRRPSSRADPIRLGWRGSHDVSNPTTPGAEALPGESETWESNCLIRRETLLHSLRRQRHASESGDSNYPVVAYRWPRLSNAKQPRFVAFGVCPFRGFM